MALDGCCRRRGKAEGEGGGGGRRVLTFRVPRPWLHPFPTRVLTCPWRLPCRPRGCVTHVKPSPTPSSVVSNHYPINIDYRRHQSGGQISFLISHSSSSFSVCVCVCVCVCDPIPVQFRFNSGSIPVQFRFKCDKFRPGSITITHGSL